LVAVGFVIIFKSTQVLNFAQPALLLLGALWVTYFTTVVGVNFWVSLIIAIALSAATGVFVERTALRPMVGKPIFAVAIMTIGLNTMLTGFALPGLGIDLRPIGEPWGLAPAGAPRFVAAPRRAA